MTGVYITAPKSGPICDFCSSPNVYASYPCVSFVHDVIEDTEINSAEHWAACRDCSELIDANRWDDLLDRCVNRFQQKYPIPLPGLRERIRLMHRQFRDHRRMSA